MLQTRTARVLFALLTLVLSACFLLPIGRVLTGGFWVDGRFTTTYLVGVFRNPIYAEGLRNSLLIAAGSTGLSLALAMPLAWISHRYRFCGQQWLTALILAPMILPPFVGAIGLLQILGPYGALNALLGASPIDWIGKARGAGVIVLQALSLYPIAYLNAVAALANIDPSMEEAAENLGCHGWLKFRRITLPLMLPGIFAGGILIFIASFTELGTPLMLNYTRCASVQVFDALKEIGQSPFPFALVFVMLIVSVMAYLLARLSFGGKAHAMHSHATIAFEPESIQGWKALAAASPFLLVLLLALLPHAGVVLTSFSHPGGWYRTVFPQVLTLTHYREALNHAMTLSGIRNSLVFSSLAVGLNVMLGLGIAFVSSRSTLRYRGVLDALSMVPLAVPGLVMAFGFLSLSAWLANLASVRNSPMLSAMLDVRINPTLFLVVAYAVRRLPYMVRAVSAGLQQTSLQLEESAANLGAGPITVIRRITLPLIAANLAAGLLLVFAFSMLEVSDSLMLAQQASYYPITKTIFELFQLIGTGRFLAAALGVWAMLFLGIAIFGSSLLLGRKMGALFRI